MKMSKDKLEKLKNEMSYYLKSNNDGEKIKRLTAVSLVASGLGVVKTSKILKISRYTLSKWIHIALDTGIEGLESIKKKGRPKGNKSSKYMYLKADLLKLPSFFNYKLARWDGKLLSYHLKEKYNTQLSVRQCQRLFHSLSFSPKETSSSSNKESGKQRA